MTNEALDFELSEDELDGITGGLTEPRRLKLNTLIRREKKKGHTIEDALKSPYVGDRPDAIEYVKAHWDAQQ